MQGSKHSGRRLLLAGVSTALVLFGCEAQQATKEQSANSTQGLYSTKSKSEGDKKVVVQDSTTSQGASALQAPASGPPIIGIGGAFQASDHQAMPIIPGEGENYAAIEQSTIKQVAEAPVSTFSIDVDTGAYANVRRFLMNGQLPPKDAVRVEEMINYFSYDYPAPTDSAQPFRVSTAVERTPWNAETYLLHVGIKGYMPPAGERPPANLVFLVDVSGSMAIRTSCRC